MPKMARFLSGRQWSDWQTDDINQKHFKKCFPTKRMNLQHFPDGRWVYYQRLPDGLLNRVTRARFIQADLVDRVSALVPLDHLSSRPMALHDRARQITPDGITQHIIDFHFLPGIIFRKGIPSYDLESLAHYGAGASEVAEAVYERIETELSPQRVLHGSAVEYSLLLVRTLQYIEQLGLAGIDWKRVETAIPTARSIDFDIDRDSRDQQFLLKVHVE